MSSNGFDYKTTEYWVVAGSALILMISVPIQEAI
jgi:hypothetical protein